MSQQVHRLSVIAQDLPMHSSLAGRTVEVAGLDAPAASVSAITVSKTHVMRPKVIYMHNVLPINEGLRSVGYVGKIAATAVAEFNEAWYFVDPTGASALFSPAFGRNYFSVYNSGTGVFAPWVSNTLTAPMPGATQATIGGQSYVCYPFAGIFTANCAAGTLAVTVITGMTPATDAVGILSASNYLISYNKTTIFWSSPTNPLDFTPSLSTGAGSGSPTELSGQIFACYPHLNGFYIYTTEGIILASYSGNAQYPWSFKSISGSVTISNPENVTHNSVDTYNIAGTATGFIKYSSSGTETVFAEVSEFLAMNRIEGFTGSVLADQNPLVAPCIARVTRIGARYVVISYTDSATAGYGIGPVFNWALVYDNSLSRWGKLRIDHQYCFSFPATTDASSLCAIAFMNYFGAVSVAKFGVAWTGAASGMPTVLVGGISVSRGTFLTLLEVDVDAGIGVFNVATATSFNGKTYGAIAAKTADANGSFPCRVTALAHMVAVTGDFTLSSLQVTTTAAGLR